MNGGINLVCFFAAMGERNASSSIVGSIVQAANRKLRKNRKTILSSSGGTPDNLSLDSSTVSQGQLRSAVEKSQSSLQHNAMLLVA